MNCTLFNGGYTNFQILLLFLILLNSCNKVKQQEVDKIIISSGPLNYNNVELRADGKYFFAGNGVSIRGFEYERESNDFDFDGIALNYYYSESEDSLFNYFVERLDNIEFSKINSGEYISDNLMIHQNFYHFCVYCTDRQKKCFFGTKFPNRLTEVIEELLETHKSLKLKKVEKKYSFATSKEVHEPAPSEYFK